MDTETLLDIAKECGCDVLYNEPMAMHTTFKVGGCCTAMIEVNSEDTMSKLIRFASKNYIRTLVLGKGSNMLCDDKGFDGVVLHIGDDMNEIRLLDETTIYAQAGCSLMKLCRFALDNSLTGLEFAYGIPGSVGGAVYMNAGAYGGEIKDVIVSANAVSYNGKVHTIEKEYLELGYRTSCLQYSDEVVSSAVFKLEKGNKDKISEKMKELMGRRKDKQPLEYPNAGSTFKRPAGCFAGKLIEDSGLRGFSVGGAQVSEKHCGFVVNKGGATASDIMALIEQVQKIVLKKTGKYLECEVRLIPYKD